MTLSGLNRFLLSAVITLCFSSELFAETSVESSRSDAPLTSEQLQQILENSPQLLEELPRLAIVDSISNKVIGLVPEPELVALPPVNPPTEVVLDNCPVPVAEVVD